MSNGDLLHYVREAIQRPLMIMPEKLAVIASVLEGRIGLDISGLQSLFDENLIAEVRKPAANRFEGDIETNDGQKLIRSRVKPYKVSNGTAVISVVGSLVNRGAWVGAYSGMTSYEGIRHQLVSAANDSTVKNVLLDISSPGGEAVGAFETGEVVARVNQTKPVSVFVQGLCCSAAYAIASGASRIEVSSTSIIGSIGVVMMHADYSKRLHDMGVKPTFIFAGAHKVDGNPYEPLSNSVKADLQAEVDKFYEMFVQHVASGRKGLSAKAVREQEARTFIGSDAVERKLADAVGTFETTLAGLQRRSISRRTIKMNDDAPIFSQTQHESLLNAAVAQARTEATQQATQATTERLTAEHGAALAAARTEAATAERGRISAIIALPEAKGREASAQHLALTTTMTAEAAAPVLAGLPQAAAGVGGIGLSVEKAKPAGGASWDNAMTRAGAQMPKKTA